MSTPPLPVSIKRNADWFEIGFVFLLLPSMVATMDHPPFYLGGKVLLWIGTWFLVRRMPDADRNQIFAGLQVWRRPWVMALTLILLAGLGALLATFSGLERFQLMESGVRWISGALLLPAFALVVSLPLLVLTAGYLPVRFADSHWLPWWLVRSLPVLGLALLHVSTLGWRAPLAAFVIGGGVWVASKGRVALVTAILLHAVIGWMGVVGGQW